MASPVTTTVSPPTADVVIVGGGIAGISLAAALGGRAGVVLLETESTLFRHTSSRSAQQVQPSYGPPDIRQLTRTSLGMLRQIDSESPTPVLSPRPLYVIALDDTPGLIDGDTGRRASSPAEVESAFPGIRPGLVRYAAVDDNASEVDVDALLQRYAHDALSSGATVVSGAKVTATRRVGSTITLTTTAGVISTPIVVNAAGAWADELAVLCGAAPRNLQPTRRSVVLATPTGRPIGSTWPMIYDAGGSLYLRPRGNDVLASPLEDEPSIAGDAKPRSAVVATALARVNELTDFRLTTALEAWTGLRTVSPDDLPVVGFDRDVDGFYWFAGQGGYGIQTSAALGTLAAGDLLGDPAPSSPADALAFSHLDPHRF